MKDNTILYVGLGLAAVYLISKRSVSIPNTLGPSGSLSRIPVIQSGGSSGSIIPTLTSLAAQITNSIKQNSNVSQGYNPDGTIQIVDTGQQSVNQLDQGQPLLSTNIPVVDTPVTSAPDYSANSSPDGTDLTDYTDMSV